MDELRLFNTYKKEVKVTFEWTGSDADPGTPYALRIILPRVGFSGTTPHAGDSGPISFEMPFDAFRDNGTPADEITIEVDNLLTAIP